MAAVFGVAIAAVLAWQTFKDYEPIVAPAVSGFQITSIVPGRSGTVISGRMDILRDCELIGVTATGGGRYVSVTLLEPPAPGKGSHSFGPWLLSPAVQEAELILEHRCATGSVKTKALFRQVRNGQVF